MKTKFYTAIQVLRTALQSKVDELAQIEKDIAIMKTELAHLLELSVKEEEE